jgi:tRNA dimethylallyltransferase
MMFDEWLVDEVKKLLKKYKKTDFWMKTIWYKEVSDYLDWSWIEYIWSEKLNLWEKEKQWIKLDLNETIELVQKNNRNYAKKQLTWFRKYEEIN